MAIYVLELTKDAFISQNGYNSFMKVVSASGKRIARKIAAEDAKKNIDCDNPKNWMCSKKSTIKMMTTSNNNSVICVDRC